MYKGGNVVELTGTFKLKQDIRSVTIPYGVKCIGDPAFKNCTNLTSIVIPDSVTKISEFVFASCADLTSVVIPDSVTYIDEWAFEGCDKLTVYCGKDSYAWQYCKRERIPCKNISGSRLVSAIRSLLGI